MLQRAASTELTVETHDVRLDYGDLTAVNNVNLQIGPGEIYGLVGPNGAGKSSLLKMLANLNRPTYGEIFINGIDLAVVFEMEENVVYIASGSPFTLIILAAQGLVDDWVDIEDMQFIRNAYLVGFSFVLFVTAFLGYKLKRQKDRARQLIESRS